MKDAKKLTKAEIEEALFVNNHILSNLKVMAKNSVDNPPRSRVLANKIEELQHEEEELKNAA